MIASLVSLHVAVPLLLVAGLAIVLLLDGRRVRRRALAELRSRWESGDDGEGDVGTARRYFDAAPAPTDPACFVLDDRTWSDLDLDEVSRHLDRCVSPVGSQSLYRLLRHTRLDDVPAADRRTAIATLAGDAALRDRLFLALHPLHDARAARVVELAWGDTPPPPRWTAAAVAVPLAATAVVALAWAGTVSWGWVVPVFLLASLAHFAHQRRVTGLPLPFLAALLGAARRIAACRDKRLDALIPRLADDAAATAPLRRRLGPLVFEDSLGLLQYVKIFWLVDVLAYALSHRELRARRPELQRLFDAVGAVDALLSVAAFHARHPGTCRPEPAPVRDGWSIRTVRHPLLAGAIANDYRPGGRGALVTGSNMAGKTTFLKTLGVNTVLAQCFGFALADEWRMPRLRVLTSIGRADNLISGRSYYMAEVESVLRLVRAAATDDPHLLLADEVFRGTNPEERLAGSAEVLRYLARGPHVVVAATHDLDLVRELGDRYDAYHFGDSLGTEGLRFDYTLRPGPCASRNAIALLAHVGYPDEIVERARRRTAGASERDALR